MANATMASLTNPQQYNTTYLQQKPGSYKLDPLLTPWTETSALRQLNRTTGSTAIDSAAVQFEKSLTLEEKIVKLQAMSPQAQKNEWRDLMAEVNLIQHAIRINKATPANIQRLSEITTFVNDRHDLLMRNPAAANPADEEVGGIPYIPDPADPEDPEVIVMPAQEPEQEDHDMPDLMDDPMSMVTPARPDMRGRRRVDFGSFLNMSLSPILENPSMDLNRSELSSSINALSRAITDKIETPSPLQKLQPRGIIEMISPEQISLKFLKKHALLTRDEYNSLKVTTPNKNELKRALFDIAQNRSGSSLTISPQSRR
jgi:hypothetical protein